MFVHDEEIHSKKRPRDSFDSASGPAPNTIEHPAKRKCRERQPTTTEKTACRRSPRLRQLKERSELRAVKQAKKPTLARSRDRRSAQLLKKRAKSKAVHILHVILFLMLAGRRKRDVDTEDTTDRAAKRKSPERSSEVAAEGVERWLNDSCSSRRLPVEDVARLVDIADTMSRRHSAALPSPRDSFDRSTSVSKRSERSTASVHDSNYRHSLQYRNIYIERENAPTELMRRAHKIISRPRASPELDDAAIQELKDKSRRLQEDAEEEIAQQLAPEIIPAMKRLPDPNLARNAHQQWSNSVPIPLDRSILTNPLPLPKPKPDLAFGYSQAAFTRDQLGTIELLVDDQFGRSYAVPDQKLRFPFLDIEFKSQAKNGTHYVATNQTANAGALALNGSIDLIQRSFGMEKFDYEEPQFFSVTMDHQFACVNVHWIKAAVDRRAYSFHVDGLSQHLLRDAKGIRAVIRAIKNVLDYGADIRLRGLCSALDAYREAVIRDREAAEPQRLRHQAVCNKSDGQGRKNTELLHEGTSTKKPRHSSIPQNTAHMVSEGEQTTKRNRRGLSTTRNLETDMSKVGSRSKLGPISRHVIEDSTEESKRRIRPMQKLIDSTDNLIGIGGAGRKGRHDA